MQQYRMLPYFVEAMVYDGDNADEIIAAFGHIVRGEDHGVPILIIHQAPDEDNELAYKGYYIYRDRKGHIHTLWPQAFEHHFEAV